MICFCQVVELEHFMTRHTAVGLASSGTVRETLALVTGEEYCSQRPHL